MKTKYFLTLLLSTIMISEPMSAQHYNGFKVAVYARAYEVRDMADLDRLDSIWTLITQQVKVDKIYLETHRDKIIVEDATLEAAKKYFEDRHIEVAGGITYTINERNRFETFCYSNPEHRKLAKEIAEHTAKHFDEYILDDFFFTSCKCKLCIEGKGDLSWTDYRLKLMTNAAQEIIITPSKAVNPNVKIIIKYPNWYEHFQGLGFNLEAEPKMFDGIYTGTETRDPERTGQHLQQYQSYSIFRYFENIKPGGNYGGWVDPGGIYYLDRYAEQLWITLFAKAPEITMFDYRQLQRPILDKDRAEWQTGGTSFDFDEMMHPINSNGSMIKPTTIARTAGITFEKVDKFISNLGNPIGVNSYKPFNSLGEDFIHSYFGMIGIPINIVPEFPKEENMILLTESAKYDFEIVKKMKERLMSGKNVMITSGLLKALSGNGIEEIVELNYSSRKSLIDEFKIGWGDHVKGTEKILIPQIEYLTNDSWEEISGLNRGIGWPLLLTASYGNASIFVITIPDNFADLYIYPSSVLDRIRQILSEDLKIRIMGDSKVSLFIYDNGTFIIQSFLDKEEEIQIAISSGAKMITDINSQELLEGIETPAPRVWGRDNQSENIFSLKIKPHSYRVFKLE